MFPLPYIIAQTLPSDPTGGASPSIPVESVLIALVIAVTPKIPTLVVAITSAISSFTARRETETMTIKTLLARIEKLEVAHDEMRSEIDQLKRDNFYKDNRISELIKERDELLMKLATETKEREKAQERLRIVQAELDACIAAAKQGK